MKLKHALTLALALGLGACGHRKNLDFSNIPDKSTMADGGTFVACSAGEATKLNPILADDSVSMDLCQMIFNGLVRYNDKLVLEGDLAQSWKFTDSGRTLTFKLRKGVAWQDGRPFSADDVVFTWKAIMDKKTASPRKADYELVHGRGRPRTR